MTDTKAALHLKGGQVRCPMCSSFGLVEIFSFEQNTFRCLDPECGAIFEVWRSGREYHEHLQSLAEGEEEWE